MTKKQQVLVGRPKFNFEGWLYKKLGNEWCGNIVPPLDRKMTHVNDWMIASYTNDAFEIGIGGMDHWLILIRREDFRKIATWHFKNWVFREWFGFRRWAWYRLLHRRANRTLRKQKA